jgi:copper transport protein
VTPRISRRTVGAAIVALAVLAGLVAGPGPRAWAHGVLRASDPADGAVIDQAPAEIRLSFTEAPELAFSSVKVLDGSGRSFGAGAVQPVAGDAETMTQAVPALPKGVYTVSWRIVSRVDGHLTAGSFAFGVQTPVTGAITGGGGPGASTPGNRSVAAVAGRALLYAGLAVLLGTAWVGALLFGAISSRDRRRALRVLVTAGWVAAAVGLVALGLAQRTTTGAALGDFLQSRLGHSVLWRGLGIVTAGVGILVSGRRWRAGMALVAAGALATIVAHVESGHAAAASPAWVMVGLQTLHVTAMAVWIGGLAALLTGLGRRSPPSPATGPEDEGAPALAAAGPAGSAGSVTPDPESPAATPAAPRSPAPGPAADADGAAATRFSTVAGVALGILVVTGVVRAIDEVNGWRALFDSTYGRLVLVKSTLLLVIAALGAVNRFRHIPHVGRSQSGLRRTGTAEVAVAAVVLAATALLTTSPPPATASVDVPSVVATASDFGTTVRARLTVSPGQAGTNRFRVRLTDYDSGKPVTVTRVTARLALPADPAVSTSTLALAPAGPGTYAASGPNLILPGRWRVTLVIERGADSLELVLDVVTRPPEGRVTITPGAPTIYSVAIDQGRSVQVYVDPERPGPTELHATFFSAAGTEEPIDTATVTAAGTTGTPRRLGPGHFVADVDAPAGAWPVEITGITPAGDYLYAPLDLEVPR